MEAKEGLRLWTEWLVVAIELLEECVMRLGVVAIDDLMLPDFSDWPALWVDPSEVMESPRA